MEILHPICCGLDVHTKTVVACLIVNGKKTTRTFGTMTECIDRDGIGEPGHPA